MPGILAWAVRGCVEWVEHGLGSAKAVEAATAEYRAETDTLEQFFEERCYFYPEGRVSRSDLYHAWEEWCDEMGEHPGKQTSFTRTVRERGVVKGFREGKMPDTARGWHGISLEDRGSEDPKDRGSEEKTGLHYPSPNSSDSKSVPEKNPCKQRGSEDPTVHFEANSQNLSEDPPRVGGFTENGPKVYRTDKSVPEPSRPPSEDDYLDGPETFEEDGLTIFYVRDERSE